jgi:virulence factor Mce-like protein
VDVRDQPPKAPSLPHRVGSVVVNHPLPIVCVIGLVLIGFYLAGTRSQPHQLKASFVTGLSVANGLDVQIDGVDVGKVSSVEYVDGQAIVGLGITDDNWPLHRGTKAMIRYGTTLGNGTRFVQLEPGPKSAPELPEDGIIAAKDTVTPVEFDEMFNTFNAATRKNLQGALRRTGDTLDGRAGALNRGIRAGAPGLEAAGGVFSDLAEDTAALQGLVANANRATRTLAARQPEIADLVTVASQTFDAFGRNAQDIRTSLDRFAPALVDTRRTLSRLDTSVGKLEGFVSDIRPGARALRPFLRRSRPAVEQLGVLAPRATSTVKAIRGAAPQITALLRTGQPFAENLQAAMSGLTPHIACIRPYAPEIAGYFTNWASFAKNFDNRTHYARVHYNSGALAIVDLPEIKSDTFMKTLGTGLSYAMPRVPGLADGKPYFLPECGAGPDALDPSKDPEDGR